MEKITLNGQEGYFLTEEEKKELLSLISRQTEIILGLKGDSL